MYISLQHPSHIHFIYDITHQQSCCNTWVLVNANPILYEVINTTTYRWLATNHLIFIGKRCLQNEKQLTSLGPQKLFSLKSIFIWFWQSVKWSMPECISDINQLFGVSWYFRVKLQWVNHICIPLLWACMGWWPCIKYKKWIIEIATFITSLNKIKNQTFQLIENF